MKTDRERDTHTLLLLCCPPTHRDPKPFMCKADVVNWHANETRTHTHTHICRDIRSYTHSHVSVQALAVSHTHSLPPRPSPSSSSSSLPAFALFKWKRLELSSVCSLERKPACQPPVPPHTYQREHVCVCECVPKPLQQLHTLPYSCRLVTNLQD